MTQTVTDKWQSFQDEISRLRAEVDAKSAEIIELQTEAHRLRPVADQVDGLRAELAKATAKLDEYLQDYKAVHEIGELRDLRAEIADIDGIMRHNAEEIARLREALKQIVDNNYSLQQLEICPNHMSAFEFCARAALSHPQKEPIR